MIKKKPEQGFFMATRSHLFNSEMAEVVHKQLTEDVGLHWHNYCECEFIFSGELTYEINEKQYLLQSGCAYIATPKDMHAIKILSEEAVEIYSLSFDESYIDSAILSRFASTDKVAFFSEAEAQKIRTLLNMLTEDYGKMLSMREVFLQTMITAVLICFLRSMETGRDGTKSPTRLVMQIVALINSNFREKLTIRAIADAIYMTPNYIGEKFKEEMGVSINSYLMETRLVYACNLLKSRKLSIKELAYQSGFSSTTHFSTSFKKRYGISPSDYLKAVSMEEG